MPSTTGLAYLDISFVKHIVGLQQVWTQGIPARPLILTQQDAWDKGYSHRRQRPKMPGC